MLCITLHPATGKLADEAGVSAGLGAALKHSLPFCVSPGPHYQLFLQLKPTMAKTRSNEQCVGHRGRRKEKKEKGEIQQQQRQEPNTC